MTEQPTKSKSNPDNVIPDSKHNSQNNQVVTGVASSALESGSDSGSIKPVNKQANPKKKPLSRSQMLLIALAVMGIGLWSNIAIFGILGALAAFLFSLKVVINAVGALIEKLFTPAERRNILAFIGFISAIAVLLKYCGFYNIIGNWLNSFKYDEFGSWAEWVGALGQISIAILAVYVAWAQYIISRDLTIQQNLITQQQTIDSYFQGISDLTINDEGLLEDWPQERAIAEGRTAAILSSFIVGNASTSSRSSGFRFAIK